MAWTWVSREYVGGLLSYRQILQEEMKPDGQSSETRKIEPEKVRKHSRKPA